MYCKVGYYDGDNSASRAIAVGWRPDVVLINPSGTTIYFRTKEMPTNSLGQFAGSQAGYVTNPAFIKTLDATGFTIGNGVNALGTRYDWVALQSSAIKDIGGILWTGNAGADNRNITGLGFQPDVVYVNSDSATPYRREWHKDRGGDSAGAYIETQAWAADHIQGVSADGFQVGTKYNENAKNFVALCLKQSNNCEVNYYTGNGAASRVISYTSIYAPKFLILLGAQPAPNNTCTRGPFHTITNSAGKCWEIGSLGETTAITGFDATTFTVSTLWNVANWNFYYFAFSEQDPVAQDVLSLPPLNSGAGGRMLPYNGYAQYKAQRAITHVINNLVLTP